MSHKAQSPRLIWEVGTGYDLFMSLEVLHNPDHFGLRGSWAAGVRSRLPAADRETFQQIYKAFYLKGQYYWVYTLPAPKDGTAILNVLEDIPPAERLERVLLHPGMPLDMGELLEGVAAGRSWAEKDQKALQLCFPTGKMSRKEAVDILEIWTHAGEWGERLLAALRAYYEVFFAEEEIRIRPALQATVNQGQALAAKLDVPTLLGEISEGIHFTEELSVAELVLIPSFWTTPLVTDIQISKQLMLFVFGARPANASLVPGEVVPDALFLALKALSDSTRLRILRYLTNEPLTPAQLARRLRLRAPTVVHHLRALRLAGLVHLTIEAGRKVSYTARAEAVRTTFTALQAFLEQDE
jgi:DNA-binding transcriptional ArsR family regulator